MIRPSARVSLAGLAALVVALLLAPSSARAQTGSIFGDGFEAGNYDAWSATSNGGGNLAVTAAAALNGSQFGLEAAVTDTTGLYVVDDTPDNEDFYAARFYFDPHDFDPGEDQSHFRTRLFIGFEEAPNRRLFAVVLKRQAGQYSLEMRVRRDDAVQVDTGFTPLSAAPHLIDVAWKRATAAGAFDGQVRLEVDSQVVGEVTGVDNTIHALDFVRMGALSVKTGASGSLYFDEFGSARALVPERLVINEVDYDQPGTDTNEFVEIYNPSFAPQALDGVHLELFNGSNNASYGDVDLGGRILGPGQYLVVSSATVAVPVSAQQVFFAAASNNVQNGIPDGLLLYDVARCRSLDALSYGGAMTAVTEPVCGILLSLTEGTAAVVVDNGVADGSLSRLPDGADTDNASVDWSFTTTPTPGAPNTP